MTHLMDNCCQMSIMFAIDVLEKDAKVRDSYRYEATSLKGAYRLALARILGYV